jgi:Tfp pilus assembly protein FimT
LQSYVNNLDSQIDIARKKAITNNTAGERADAQDEANGKSRFKNEVIEKMKSMKCDIASKDVEQKKNLEEALYLTKNILEQSKTKSNTFTYIIVGGVVALGVVAFIVIRNAKKGTSSN